MSRTSEIMDLVTNSPGITSNGIRTKLGDRGNSVYQALSSLKTYKKLVKEGNGWFLPKRAGAPEPKEPKEPKEAETTVSVNGDKYWSVSSKPQVNVGEALSAVIKAVEACGSIAAVIDVCKRLQSLKG